uniref:Uncharacterized protein n=1 Tax=Denticeps clupeoides TaxID=299321 RepID=A0AAY4CI12_9TELE
MVRQSASSCGSSRDITSQDCWRQKTHLEVVGIHVQLLGVQHAQLRVGGLDVVHVLHGPVQPLKHHLAVGGDHGVALDGGGVVQVSEAAEVALSPGIHNQTPVRRTSGQFKSIYHISFRQTALSVRSACKRNQYGFTLE